MDSGNSGRESRRETLGQFIRNQREITRLSMRQLATLAHISNPYLSQIERGLYRPSADILRKIAEALGISPERLFEMAGFLSLEEVDAPTVEAVIRLDDRLTTEQKETLLRVYRGFVEAGRADDA